MSRTVFDGRTRSVENQHTRARRQWPTFGPAAPRVPARQPRLPRQRQRPRTWKPRTISRLAARDSYVAVNDIDRNHRRAATDGGFPEPWSELRLRIERDVRMNGPAQRQGENPRIYWRARQPEGHVAVERP